MWRVISNIATASRFLVFLKARPPFLTGPTVWGGGGGGGTSLISSKHKLWNFLGTVIVFHSWRQSAWYVMSPLSSSGKKRKNPGILGMLCEILVARYIAILNLKILSFFFPTVVSLFVQG